MDAQPEPTPTPAPVRTARAEKHRLYMQTYNRKYIRKSEQKRSVDGLVYDSLYKLAKATADRKAANGGFLKRENGVITSPDTLRYKEYLARHNRKAFITYIDADIRKAFTDACKESGEPINKVVEHLMEKYIGSKVKKEG